MADDPPEFAANASGSRGRGEPTGVPTGLGHENIGHATLYANWSQTPVKKLGRE
jgi:hypothetical protein